jgi:hypothetical protein
MTVCVIVVMLRAWCCTCVFVWRQLPERAARAAEPAKKSLPFFGSTEYGDGTGAAKAHEHCPVEDIYQAGIDPLHPVPGGAKTTVRTVLCPALCPSCTPPMACGCGVWGGVWCCVQCGVQCGVADDCCACCLVQ